MYEFLHLFHSTFILCNVKSKANKFRKLDNLHILYSRTVKAKNDKDDFVIRYNWEDMWKEEVAYHVCS